MSLIFDTSDFDRKFKRIVEKAIPDSVERGIGKAMLQLMNDCIMENPTVPLLEGWLRGSGSAFVQNKFVGDSSARYKDKFACKSHQESLGNNMIGMVGFNTPYAAKLHEGVGLHFTEPSAGPKYLESKLMRNKNRYMKIVANTVKDAK